MQCNFSVRTSCARVACAVLGVIVAMQTPLVEAATVAQPASSGASEANLTASSLPDGWAPLGWIVKPPLVEPEWDSVMGTATLSKDGHVVAKLVAWVLRPKEAKPLVDAMNEMVAFQEKTVHGQPISVSISKASNDTWTGRAAVQQDLVFSGAGGDRHERLLMTKTSADTYCVVMYTADGKNFGTYMAEYEQTKVRFPCY